MARNKIEAQLLKSTSHLAEVRVGSLCRGVCAAILLHSPKNSHFTTRLSYSHSRLLLL